MNLTPLCSMDARFWIESFLGKTSDFCVAFELKMTFVPHFLDLRFLIASYGWIVGFEKRKKKM